FTESDDLHVVKGKHSLTAGVWIQRIQSNLPAGGQSASGQASYPTLLAFLQDAPQQIAINAVTTPLGWRSTEAAWYLQDEIKLRPNLTVRLGLRDEMTNGWNEAHNRASNYLYDTNGVIKEEPF